MPPAGDLVPLKAVADDCKDGTLEDADVNDNDEVAAALMCISWPNFATRIQVLGLDDASVHSVAMTANR